MIAQRIDDYAAITAGSVFLAPHLLVLFLLGILAVRLGWLTRPGRHSRLWRRVRLAGFCIGLPFNLLWAIWALNQAVNPLDPPPYGEIVFALLPVGGSLLAAAYLASVMLAQGTAQRILFGWLAPVGRMALSNYLSHSLLGVLLLQGAGLGLGAMAVRSPALLMGLALAHHGVPGAAKPMVAVPVSAGTGRDPVRAAWVKHDATNSCDVERFYQGEHQ